METKKPISATLFQQIAQDQESQICFGAALICLAIGLIGLALKVYFSLSSTLEAMLVISVFYGLLGFVRAAHVKSEFARIRSQLLEEDNATHDPNNNRSAA